MLSASRALLRRGCGIVGLPNIGKSTLFNALTRSSQAKTGNYPFCTIDANRSHVDVYDARLEQLAKFTGASKIVNAEVDVSDVAGLIAGAHKGEGLGNKFLNDIRPVNVILHMVRCFESAKDGFDTPTPLEGISVINNELVLADLQSVEKRIAKNKVSKGKSDAGALFTQKVHAALSEGKSANSISVKDATERQLLNDMQLLSAKPQLFVLNVGEDEMVSGNAFSKQVETEFGEANTVRVCSVIEEQTATFNRAERLEFLDAYGLKTPAAEELMRRVFALLKLQTFFTVGPKMAVAWSIPQGTDVRNAAGEIHGDFAKHFVGAQVLPWERYVGYKNYKDADGHMPKVPNDYVMEDGDVLIVHHNAQRN